MLIMAVSVPLLAACSAIGTLINRPVVENSIEGAVSTVSLSADRRSVVVVTEGKNRGKYCAEPPPDTAKEIATQFRAAAEAQASSPGQPTVVGRGAIEDLFREQLHVLAQRTPALEAFRIGLYALCQMYVIGAISEAQTDALIHKLIESYPWNIAPAPIVRTPTSGAQPAPDAPAGGPAVPSAPARPSAPAAPAAPKKVAPGE